MSMIQTVRDFFDMKIEDQGSFIAGAKKVWDKCPLWVRSLAVAIKLTLILMSSIYIVTNLFGTGLLVLAGILGLWWVIHQMMQKGISKTISQLWAILVVDESVVTTETVTKVPVVENDATPTKRTIGVVE